MLRVLTNVRTIFTFNFRVLEKVSIRIFSPGTVFTLERGFNLLELKPAFNPFNYYFRPEVLIF